MEKATHFLYPAAIYASRKPTLVTTILGSCVAVCFWDPVQRIGGINHFMLPFWNGQGLASPKYGNIAIEKLVGKLESYGTKRGHLKAKLFGGSEVISTNISQFKIGTRNIEIARQLLEELKIPVVGSSTGGGLGRKIIYNTQTGEVMQRFIKSGNAIPYLQK